MKQTHIIMGMPITVDVLGGSKALLTTVFDYFRAVDARFSTYKSDSEISRINTGLPKAAWSKEMKEVLNLCEQTKRETDGFFNIEHNGKLDPSGLVKGWAIHKASLILDAHHQPNYYIEAGGDIAVRGHNQAGEYWQVGIRNPFSIQEIIKVLSVTDCGVATSGTYIRGEHIYNPHTPRQPLNEITSLTVIGPNIYEADRFATAAFAMGRSGIAFIEQLKGFEGYMVDSNKQATYTSGFESYVATPA